MHPYCHDSYNQLESVISSRAGIDGLPTLTGIIRNKFGYVQNGLCYRQLLTHFKTSQIILQNVHFFKVIRALLVHNTVCFTKEDAMRRMYKHNKLTFMIGAIVVHFNKMKVIFNRISSDCRHLTYTDCRTVARHQEAQNKPLDNPTTPIQVYMNDSGTSRNSSKKPSG